MRKYIIGILIGFCLSFGVGAHAEISSYVGRVIEGAFPVTYNDAAIGDGLVIDGTTYLPVRKLGEAMGLTVLFDADLGVSLKKVISVTGDTYGLEPTIKEVPELMKMKANVPLTVDQIDKKIEKAKINEQHTIAAIKEMEKDSVRQNRTLEDMPKYQPFKNLLAGYEAELADLERQKAELANP